jgi:hypothetical protein
MYQISNFSLPFELVATFSPRNEEDAFCSEACRTRFTVPLDRYLRCHEPNTSFL